MEIDDQTNINPLALLFLLVAGYYTLRGSRAAAVKSLLAIAAFLPLGQQVIVFGLHLQFFRILVLVGYFRVFSRGETRNFTLNTIDKLTLVWAAVGLVCCGIRSPAKFFGDDGFGRVFNCAGVYFLIRLLLQDPADVIGHLRFLAIVAVVTALSMSYEFVTHHNLFHVFGGVPADTIQRDGDARFRCQGSFRHPILAGTFAASLFSLMMGLWLCGGKDKRLATIGLAASAFSTFAAASSGALMTCVAALIGLALWPMRDRMQIIRRGMVAVILVLMVVMKQPVWYLIARVSDMVGGGGWHRSYLIDQFVNHFNEWWLVGTSYTAHWAPSGIVLASDPNNMDITNHYVAQGLKGGLLGLCLFIAIITYCFKAIGNAVRSEQTPPLPRKLLWVMGATLAAHCAAFISVFYFDQIELFWFWLVAAISSVMSFVPEEAEEIEGEEAPRAEEGVGATV
jgi:hypothetical protein